METILWSYLIVISFCSFIVVDLSDFNWEDDVSSPLYQSIEYIETSKAIQAKNTHLPLLNSKVAVKKMVLKHSVDGISREAIRELKLLQELRHPNVVTVYDSYIKHDNLYMVMEVLPNDLERLVRQGNITLTQGHIKTILTMILKGIGHLHFKNIMHRDLKPANVLMAPDGTMKIADFGGAKLAGSPDRRYVH